MFSDLLYGIAIEVVFTIQVCNSIKVPVILSFSSLGNYHQLITNRWTIISCHSHGFSLFTV